MNEIHTALQEIMSDTSGQIFVIAVVTGVAHLFARIIIGAIKRSAKRTSNIIDDMIIDALRKPLLYFVWVVGSAWALDVIGKSNQLPLIETFQSGVRASVIGLLAWGIIRTIRVAENIYRERSANSNEPSIDDGTLAAIAKLLRIAVLFTAVLVILQTFGYSISGVLAFGGVGGIAIGFAARDLLANFFGGLMVYLDRPFSVGDWIRSPDKDIEGTVEHIGWRVTRIRTFDMRPLYVPNSTFTTIAVENPSRMLNRRIYETIGLRYDDAAQVHNIVEAVKYMLQNHTAIDTDRTLMVNFNEFGASSLDFFVYCFTKTTIWTEYHQVKQDVLLQIQKIIAEHGADIAYPTSRIQLEQIENAH